jgi:hypothetical protein
VTAPRAALLAVGAASIAVGVFLACKPSPGISCPTLSTGCPSPPPDWETDVQPLFVTYSAQCHGDGGIEQAMFDYTTYQGVYGHRSQILTEVYECQMPPYDASPPTAAFPSAQERQTFISWLVCGAPGPDSGSAAGSDGGTEAGADGGVDAKSDADGGDTGADADAGGD